jgi:hypothetical protein
LSCSPYYQSASYFIKDGPDSRFPLTPSSLHGLHIFLLPLGPTPNGKGPTLSRPPNPVDPPCLLDSASSRRSNSAVESVVAFCPGPAVLGPEPEGGTRSEWVAYALHTVPLDIGLVACMRVQLSRLTNLVLCAMAGGLYSRQRGWSRWRSCSMVLVYMKFDSVLAVHAKSRRTD